MIEDITIILCYHYPRKWLLTFDSKRNIYSEGEE